MTMTMMMTSRTPIPDDDGEDDNDEYDDNNNDQQRQQRQTTTTTNNNNDKQQQQQTTTTKHTTNNATINLTMTEPPTSADASTVPVTVSTDGKIGEVKIVFTYYFKF